MARTDGHPSPAQCFLIALCLAFALCAGTAFGQAAPGIYISAQVYTQLPTTTLGGGGTYNVSAGSNSPIIQNSYSLPPYGHADSVVAFDPNANGLYSASAASSINVLSSYDGILSVSGQTSGGTADPNLPVDAESIGNVTWIDQVFVAGLAAGTPITLEITDKIEGHLSFLPSNLDDGSRLYHGIQISTGYTGPQFDDDLSPDTNYTASGSITSTHPALTPPESMSTR